jgi:patatin-like phospholipase/acyl hydrolase
MGTRGHGDAGPIRVLSIDGGGVRGIIPARVLVELERLTGKQVRDLFDVIAGTSTGGIIALLLASPGTSARGPLDAAGVLELYHSEIERIFPQVEARDWREWWDSEQGHGAFSQRFGAALLPHHYGNARYLPVGLEDALGRMLGDAKLAEATVDVVIPAYDMSRRQPFLFRSADARSGKGPNLEMKLVARATSAAPTYFPPLRLDHPEGESVLVDGGLVANNPVTLAYFDAVEQDGSNDDLDAVIVSLGTGLPTTTAESYEQIWSRTWPQLAVGLLGVVFDGTSELANDLVRRIIEGATGQQRFWRIQTDLHDCSFHLDDASPENLARLHEIADELVTARAEELGKIAAALTEPQR